MRSVRLLATFVLLLSVQAFPAFADTRTSTLGKPADPRGEPELVVCSQNLHNYGAYETARIRDPGLSTEDFRRKEADLVKRFTTAGCDVIAVQELMGRNEFDAKAGLEQLALALRRATNRVFDAVAGPSNEFFLRVGFLIARDRATLLNKTSYIKVQLPKLTEKERPRFFNRAPLEIQLNVKAREGSYSKTVTLINFHLKSRAGKGDDPSGLEWEPLRIQMAEAIRRVVENRHAKLVESGESLLVVLGDRNSNFDMASARVLDGTLKIKDFQANGACRLSKRGVPLCKAGTGDGRVLFSVLTEDPRVKTLPGTYTYHNAYSWLDDIMMPPTNLPFAAKSVDLRGEYASGVVYEPANASDHAMVWAALNW